MAKRDVVKEIRRATRRKFGAEEKIRVVLEGLRGEIPITELCRREAIAPDRLLQVVEGLSGRRQERPDAGHAARFHVRRGEAPQG